MVLSPSLPTGTNSKRLRTIYYIKMVKPAEVRDGLGRASVVLRELTHP